MKPRDRCNIPNVDNTRGDDDPGGGGLNACDEGDWWFYRPHKMTPHEESAFLKSMSSKADGDPDPGQQQEDEGKDKCIC